MKLLIRVQPAFQKLYLAIIIMLIVTASNAQPLKVAVAGLSHDHVYGILNQFKNGEVIILGIAEADQQLAHKYQAKFQLPDSLFFKDISTLLAHVKPEVMLAYNPISEHITVVEACAPKMISVMVEKPLATTVAQANRMAALAKQYHIDILTNYETTWYPSNQQAWQIVNNHSIGEIRKIIVHSGHQGPKEIGCSPEFLQWLTDPVKNGGGAVMDFGCYGANLVTWFMQGKAPVSVTAVTKHIKPAIYPKVDDDATILLEYPNATAIIEASWNWPYGIKDMQVFGQTGCLYAVNGNTLEKKDTGAFNRIPLTPPVYKNNLAYLDAVLRKHIHPDNDLSSLENNLIVVRILEAARQSAQQEKRIVW